MKLLQRLSAIAILLLLSQFYVSAQTYTIEGFEAGVRPAGWINIYTSSDYWNVVATGSYPTNTPHTGSYMFQYNAFDANSGEVQTCITSPFNFTNRGDSIIISFWLYRHNAYSTYAGSPLQILVNTTQSLAGATLLTEIGSGLTSLNMLYTNPPVVPAIGWYQYRYAVPASFNGAANYILFSSTSDWYNNVQIDDLAIYSPIPPIPMSLNYNNTIQVTDPVVPATFGAPIIGLDINMLGNLNPWQFNSATFSTTGTTNLTDITSAKLYYTKTLSASNATQIGTAIINPSGTISFSTGTVTQILGTGHNYFFLTYDVSPTAVLGDPLDGAVWGFTLTPNGGSYTKFSD
jgi:hypothetical protein